MKQVVGREGAVLTVPAARAKDARPSNVHWLTPRTWRRWIEVGLRGHTRDGVPELGWVGRLEDRNVAFVRLLVTSGLRRAEGGSLLTFEVPARQVDGARYYRGKVAAEVTRSKKAANVLRRRRRGRGDRGVRGVLAGVGGAPSAEEEALRPGARQAGGHRGYQGPQPAGALA